MRGRGILRVMWVGEGSVNNFTGTWATTPANNKNFTHWWKKIVENLNFCTANKNLPLSYFYVYLIFYFTFVNLKLATDAKHTLFFIVFPGRTVCNAWCETWSIHLEQNFSNLILHTNGQGILLNLYSDSAGLGWSLGFLHV